MNLRKSFMVPSLSATALDRGGMLIGQRRTMQCSGLTSFAADRGR